MEDYVRNILFYFLNKKSDIWLSYTMKIWFVYGGFENAMSSKNICSTVAVHHIKDM